MDLPSALCPLPSKPRGGFTLVELLVTISVIAILASMLLGALYAAQDSARKQKTRSTIVKLHTMMMQRWESYKTRRAPITIPPGTDPKTAAKIRLNAIRELMRFELPDRNNEVPDSSVTSVTIPPGIVMPRPSISQSYKRRLGTPADTQFQAAEILYLILTTAVDDDESGIEKFGDSEIGDKDNDGRREFWDAWQNPISWIRWPAGFNSEVQPQTTKAHDPFDPREIHDNAYPLSPLIFSPGPDGKYEFYTNPNNPFTYNPQGILDTHDPMLGKWDENPADSDGVNDSIDNIHNHMIGSR